MKAYSGRRVRIYKWNGVEQVDTGKTGRLLDIDVHDEQIMIEDDGGNMVKLFYKLVKLI
jgi:hypothetical protein